jgi:hypothetical protein
VDIQEATTVGTFVWTADYFRGGNVGVQQFGEIAERVGDAPGKLSFGCNCHASERSSVAREPIAGGEVVRVAPAEKILVLELQPSSLGCEYP